ncbi:hypothetical protein [Roseimaritima sediminicola]|uniref:hypothetical protein n=1 Tax=Roseimaritima sediminicola TaxID=2662066 RepID=UPI0012982C94|nr:hypothetical protein [Roseimaritima sediminicola]
MNEPNRIEPNRKQSANVYTVMLLLSMLFMFVAVIAMFVEFRRYEGTLPWKTDDARPQVMHAIDAPHYL